MLSEKIKKSVDFISSLIDTKPRVGIVLGSGLSSFADAIEVDAAIPYSEIPHFNSPTVAGHPGQLVAGKLGDVPVVILQGRVHFYEGHDMQDVVYPTRVLVKLGIDSLVLTNAAGGIDPDMKPGDFMIIKDHINLFGTNPLIGKNDDDLGPRFPDMTEAYDKELIEKLKTILKKKEVRFSEGVYAGVHGPCYETAAEVRYLGKVGANAVGMSTVPEAIIARHMGAKVCGISCITNNATGVTGEKLSHDEVKDVAQKVESVFKEFLTEFVQEL